MTAKFQLLTDNNGDFLTTVDRDTFLTNVTLYWVTDTVGSAMRIYRENRLTGKKRRERHAWRLLWRMRISLAAPPCARRRAVGRDRAHLPAEGLFQPAVDRLHDLHGAGRRARDLRRRHPRRDRLFRHRGVVRRGRVWYLVGLGATALVFALALPRGAWGFLEDRTALRLLPIGYRLISGRLAGPRARASANKGAD